jgi:hypothetical protein
VGAVVRKGALGPAGELGWLDESTIICFYLTLLQAIVADLTSELGGKRASAALDACLRQSTYYQRFLSVVQLEEGAAVVDRILTRVEEQGQKLPKKEMIKGFNQVVIGLFREESRLLGAKATAKTVSRLRQSLESVPGDQQALAKAMTKFLDTLGDGGFQPGARKYSGTMELEPAAATDGSLPPLDLSNLGGAAIVTFYNQMIQVVMADLEQELGAKARQLFGSMVENSKYYRTFLSQFNLGSDPAANITRIRDHLKTQEVQLGKPELVQAFQQVLYGLLREEKKLLGVRASQVTISRLGERMKATDMTRKPLADHLSAFLLSATSSM